MISYNVLQKRLIFQKYKKKSPGKYALLLYLAISMRWISIMFDAENGGKRRYFRHFYKTNVGRYRCESII